MRGSGGPSPPSAGGSRRAPRAGWAGPRLCAVAGRAWAVAAVGAGARARAPPSPLSEPPEAARRPRLASRPGALGADGAEAGERQCRRSGGGVLLGRRTKAGSSGPQHGARRVGGRRRARRGAGGEARRAGPASLRFVCGAARLSSRAAGWWPFSAGPFLPRPASERGEPAR